MSHGGGGDVRAFRDGDHGDHGDGDHGDDAHGAGRGRGRGVGVQVRGVGSVVAIAPLCEVHDGLATLHPHLHLDDCGVREGVHDAVVLPRDGDDVHDSHHGVPADVRGGLLGDVHGGALEALEALEEVAAEAEVEASPGLGECRAGTSHRSGGLSRTLARAAGDQLQYDPIGSGAASRSRVSRHEYRRAKCK